MKAIWKNKTLRNVFFLGLAHFLLTMVLLIYAFGEGMARFDEGSPPTAFENYIDVVVEILMQPGSTIYDLIPKEKKTDLIEWTLVAVNSLLWGFGVLFLWRGVCRFKNKL